MSEPTFAETIRALTVNVTVEGAESLDLLHGKTRILPSAVSLHFNRSAGASWRFNAVEVSGPNVKKNGETGANQHENRYYRSFSSDAWWNTPPDWVLALADTHLSELNGGVS